MKEQSPQFLKDLHPVMVNGEQRHQLADGSHRFVSRDAAATAHKNTEDALRETVKELAEYGHETSQFEHEVMSKQLGLDSKPAAQWKSEVANDNDASPSAEEAEKLQHDERQAAYDALFAGKSDADIDREVAGAGYRRRQREAEAKHAAETEARVKSHADREKLKNLEDVQKMSMSELADILGEKPDFKVSKADYVARVKAKQQEAIEYKAPTVDLVTPAVKEPSESTKATIEAIKKFHKEMGGVETDEQKLAYKQYIKEDVDAFLSLSDKKKKELLTPTEAVDLKLRAKILQAAEVEGDESVIEDGYDKAIDALMDDFLALTAYRRITGKLSDEEELTVSRLKALILEVNDRINHVDGLSEEDSKHQQELMAEFLAEEDSMTVKGDAAVVESDDNASEENKLLPVPVLYEETSLNTANTPEEKKRGKKILAAAAMLGLAALSVFGLSKLGDDSITIDRDSAPVETTVEDEEASDSSTPAGEDGDSTETEGGDEETTGNGNVTDDEDGEESSDGAEDDADNQDKANGEADNGSETAIVGAENFEVEAGSGLVQEIKDFAEANNLSIDDDQAFALYQAGLAEFGKDGLISGGTYEISPGNIGISSPGKTSWNPAFVQFMMERMQSANTADSELPETL